MTKPDLMAELAEVVRLMKERQELFDARKYYSGDLLEPRISHAAVELIRTHHAELEAVVRDAALLDFQERECITVRCEAVDCHDVIYEAVEYHMDEPEERVIGTGPTPREALIQAMHNSAREG